MIAFAAAAVVVAWGLDSFFDFGLRHIRTSKFGALAEVFAGRVNADVVVNGSSRALTHYDPRVIEAKTGLQAYNIGMNGIQIDVQLGMLKAYLKHNRKPRVVIQNLEAFSFETTRPGEIYDPAAYLPYLWDDEVYQCLLKIDPNVWKWKHIPLYGYAVEDMTFSWVWGVLGVAGISSKQDYFRGFNPRFISWTEDFERFKAAVGDGVTYRIEPAGVACLRELIDICRASQIQLILVYSPEYRPMQGLEKNRREIIEKFRQLCANADIPFWDYSDSAICAERDNFYNSQHLNWKGAHLFSEDLADRLARWLADVGVKNDQTPR